MRQPDRVRTNLIDLSAHLPEKVGEALCGTRENSSGDIQGHGRFWRLLFGGAGHFLSYFLKLVTLSIDLNDCVLKKLNKLRLSWAKLSRN